jgi:hypothetical protein
MGPPQDRLGEAFCAAGFKARGALLSARISRVAFGTDNRQDVVKYVIAVEVPSHAAHSEHDADPGVWLSRVIDPFRRSCGSASADNLMNRAGEYAGDAASEAGKGGRVAGASGRVEFSDRQRSHPRVSRCQLERRCGLVEGRSGVAAVGTLRQRGIDEVEDVNIDVKGERTGREMVKCSPGGTGWIGGECLAGGHVQAEPVSLLALPVGSHVWLDPEPCDLVGLKQRPGPERVGEGVHATGQGQRVR